MTITTDPLRGRLPAIAAALRLARRALAHASEHGLRATARKVVAYLRLRRALARRIVDRRSAERLEAIYSRPVARPAAGTLATRVVILAELSLPQCAKYRVWQKKAHLDRLGIACRVVDWRRSDECRSAVQLATVVILYRVPGYPEVLSLIGEIRRLGVRTLWEVDDLIFDEAIYRQNRNLETLDKATRNGILDGIPLYRRALLACDGAIASTPALADAMRAAGVSDVMVIENGLDDETLGMVAAIRNRPLRRDGHILVTYGSGSRAHDADFACAAPALAELLRSRPQVRLRLLGEVAVPPVLQAFASRLERLDSVPYRAYLELLGESDIAIAPLEGTVFNDAKSNIKYLEASVLEVPSVCSPRAAFRSTIDDGSDGFLADSTADWLDRLLRLVDDGALRKRMGRTARQSVLERYSPDAIARRQVRHLAQPADTRRKPALRVLAANVYFWPQSYGGATVVAEEMARHLHARPDTEVHVFTSSQRASDPPDTLVRYEHGDIPVIAVRLPGFGPVRDFDNPSIGGLFDEVLAAVQPDVVHLHSIQGFGAMLAGACTARKIPYVVTLHDAWWLCPRQFMVREDGQYCFQTTIDLNVCRSCMPGTNHLQQRMDVLLGALRGADCLLSPSESHRKLYLANGLPPDRVLVNRNGIRPPRRPRSRRPADIIRFGYVGGEAAIKGFPLIRRAFEGIRHSNYSLCIVDHTLNLGYSSLRVSNWKVAGQVAVVPAYTQETVDEFFDTIDVLLFPSQWKESFGLTVREALARDVWVIATEGGAPAEAIVDGVNGTLIPLDGRHAALQAAITAILEAPERFASYCNPLKHQVLTFDQQAEELRDMLRAVVRPGEACASGCLARSG